MKQSSCIKENGENGADWKVNCAKLGMHGELLQRRCLFRKSSIILLGNASRLRKGEENDIKMRYILETAMNLKGKHS